MKWDAWLPVIVGVAGVAALVVWSNSGGKRAPDEAERQPDPDRKLECRSLKGTPGERLDACFAELSQPLFSKRAGDTMRGLGEGGKVLAAGPVRVDGLELERITEHAELRELAMATDEAAFAKALRDGGFRGLLVHRDITGALDRDQVVLARLAHHDFLEWFQLRYVAEGLLVYTVRSSPARIPVGTGDALLKSLRARLAGRAPTKQKWNPDIVRLMGVIRLQGSMLVIRHAVNEDLEQALDNLAAAMRRDWERKRMPEGHGTLEERLPDMRLEVHVVMEKAPVDPRTRFAIFDLFEMGVDGMMFKHGRTDVKDQKFTYMPGSEALTLSRNSPDSFLQHATKWGGWRDRRPWEDKGTHLDMIRTSHFMESERGGGEAVRLFRGMPEVPLSEVDDKRVQDMLVSGGEWWLYNMRPDKSYEYKYWPTQNRRSTEYNEVRHILAARDLSDTWRYRKDPRYLEGARGAMDWLLRYQVHDTDEPAMIKLGAKGTPVQMPHPPEGTMLFRYPSVAEAARGGPPPNQKLGTVAVALLGWIAWADATGSHEQDENIRKMARFTKYMQESDGRYKGYFVPRGHPYQHESNDIVPGEAALALGMVAEYFDEPDWVDGHPKFVEYYLPWFRKRAKRKNPLGRWPHDTYANQDRLDLVQFGPWSVMAAKQYHRMTGDAEAGSFGLEVADWMIDNYQWSGARSPWPDYVGGYYKLPNELPAMQTFCYSEGTAAAYQLASTFAPERRDKFELATRESIRFLGVMQYDDLDSYFVADPRKVKGGIKYTMNENKVRIDYVGHGLSTLSQYLDARAYDPNATLDIYDPDDLLRVTREGFGGDPSEAAGDRASGG